MDLTMSMPRVCDIGDCWLDNLKCESILDVAEFEMPRLRTARFLVALGIPRVAPDLRWPGRHDGAG